jgi:hypothetical protein
VITPGTAGNQISKKKTSVNNTKKTKQKASITTKTIKKNDPTVKILLVKLSKQKLNQSERI